MYVYIYSFYVFLLIYLLRTVLKKYSSSGTTLLSLRNIWVMRDWRVCVRVCCSCCFCCLNLQNLIAFVFQDCWLSALLMSFMDTGRVTTTTTITTHRRCVCSNFDPASRTAQQLVQIDEQGSMPSLWQRLTGCPEHAIDRRQCRPGCVPPASLIAVPRPPSCIAPPPPPIPPPPPAPTP